MNNTTEYIPGICNINPREVKRRRTIGIIGLAVTVVLTALLLALDVSSAFRVVIFIPAFIMATGFLQAHAKFCVGFASAGMQHVGTNAQQIKDKAALGLDKKRAKKINIQAFLVAVVTTAIILFLPR